MAYIIEEKIKPQKEIFTIARQLRDEGKRTVVLTGCFDIVHRGHINSLLKAKEQGDVLIVLMNSDKSVRAYKGKRRPIIRENDRVLLIAAFACVDYVVLFGGLSPVFVAKKIRPDVYCNGLDWEKEIMKDYCEENYVIKRTKGISTTGIIEKILRL